MVARRQDDRLRHRSRRRQLRPAQVQAVAHRPARRRDRCRRPCSRIRRGSTSIRSGRRTADRSRTSRDRTGTANVFLYDLDDARALPAHQRRRRRVGADGIQPGDQLGAAGRSARVHLLRERAVHDLDGEQSARAANAPRIAIRPRRPSSWRRRAERQRARRAVSVVALLDSFELGLPDTTRFRVISVSRAAPGRTTRRVPASATRPTRSDAACSAERRWC